MQIDHNIPMPTLKSKERLQDIIVQMKVGDSVLTNYQPAGASAAFAAAARAARVDFKFTNAAEGSKRRVWRIA